MLVFSGLEAQGEINRLLDELFGGSEQAYSTTAKGREEHEAKIPADCETAAENKTNKELGVVRELVLAP